MAFAFICYCEAIKISLSSMNSCLFLCFMCWLKHFFLHQSSKIESAENSPVTPPLSKERPPRNFHRPLGKGYSSSDSLEHHSIHGLACHYHDSGVLNSTPKLSSISGAKTETSSMDASIRTSSSREADCSGELSVSTSNASDQEKEWVEQDDPGVYITIRALPGGTKELRRVRFRWGCFFVKITVATEYHNEQIHL